MDRSRNRVADTPETGDSGVDPTIADLDNAELLASPHVAEALQYRKREGG
jgi:predicted ATPase with chaperone activity